MSDKDLISSMYDREENFVYSQHVRLYTTTWNVCAMDPSKCNVANWITDTDLTDVELVVIHLQEMVDLDNPFNVTYLGDLSTQQYAKQWQSILLTSLNNRTSTSIHTKFISLCAHYLVGIATFVYIAQPLHSHTSDIRCFHYGTGFLGCGNKGAIGLAFTVYDTPIVTINNHLPHGTHPGALEQRMSDIHTIINHCSFDKGSYTDVLDLGCPPSMRTTHNDEDEDDDDDEMYRELQTRVETYRRRADTMESDDENDDAKGGDCDIKHLSQKNLKAIAEDVTASPYSALWCDGYADSHRWRGTFLILFYFIYLL